MYTADRTEAMVEDLTAQNWTAADHTEVKSETENVAAVFADQAFADQAFAAELVASASVPAHVAVESVVAYLKKDFHWT